MENQVNNKLQMEKFTTYTQSIKMAVKAYQKLVISETNSRGVYGIALSVLSFAFLKGTPIDHAMPLAIGLLWNAPDMIRSFKFSYEQKKQEKILKQVLELGKEGYGEKVQNFVDNFLNWSAKNPRPQGLSPKKRTDSEMVLKWLKDNEINSINDLKKLLKGEFSKTTKMTKFV